MSDFRLDEFEVTVGRFRKFVAAWNGGDAGYFPSPGSGKHAHLNGGLGLANSAAAGGYETGWVASDDINVAPTDANLGSSCSSNAATWTPSPGANEKLPITCVNWYEAYAFCIWDVGFLPSEAEWEYAAAGGMADREYPWGSATPGQGNVAAIYGCFFPNGSGTCTGVANIAPVGTPIDGRGMWGQFDLAGNVQEWVLDYVHASYVVPCVDCATVTAGAAGTGRVYRGGNWGTGLTSLLPTSAVGVPPTFRDGSGGFRCARAP